MTVLKQAHKSYVIQILSKCHHAYDVLQTHVKREGEVESETLEDKTAIIDWLSILCCGVSFDPYRCNVGLHFPCVTSYHQNFHQGVHETFLLKF